jgi:hypothetical protein
MFLVHFDTAMAKQRRYLIDRNSCQQQFHGKGVAEHVRMATFARAIRISDVGDAKELAKAALVTLDRTGQIAMATPEKMIGTRRWQRPQQRSNGGRQERPKV